MARKLQEIMLKRDETFTLRIIYQLWCDLEMAAKINAIPGIRFHFQTEKYPPFRVEFDPRYDAAELETEILALGNL